LLYLNKNLEQFYEWYITHSARKNWRYMNLSEVNQIREIKKEFLSNTEPETRKRALYALGNFSSEGIDTIHELIGATKNDDVKVYGFEVITKTKKSMNL
jgi:hypothetical protein